MIRKIFRIVNSLFCLLIIYTGVACLYPLVGYEKTVENYSFNEEAIFDELPACCTDAIEGWTIKRVSSKYMPKLYNTNDSAKFYVGEAVGLTVPKESIVYLESENDYNAARTLCHELGHVVDNNEKTLTGIAPSQTEEFLKIYDSEAIYGTYGYASASEFFAETYGAILKDDKETLSKTPNAEAYVLQYMYDLENNTINNLFEYEFSIPEDRDFTSFHTAADILVSRDMDFSITLFKKLVAEKLF